MDIEQNLSLLSKYHFPIKCVGFMHVTCKASRHIIKHYIDSYTCYDGNSLAKTFLRILPYMSSFEDTIELNHFVDADNREFYIERTVDNMSVFDSFPKQYTVYLLAQ